MAITRHYTVADLADMPDDGQRHEVIDGELLVTAIPHSDHQAAIVQISVALQNWDSEQLLGVALPGVGLIFAEDTGVIPDLVWVSAARAAEVLIEPRSGRRDGKLHTAPDLIVEVVSPGRDNEERDRKKKLALYGRRGVGEYWIVDRERQTVEVYRRESGGELALAATLTAAGRLTSPLLPAFAMPVERIFRLPGWLPR